MKLLVIGNDAFFVLVMLNGHFQNLTGQFAEAGLLLDELKSIWFPCWHSTIKQFFKDESLKIHKTSFLKKGTKQFIHDHRWNYASIVDRQGSSTQLWTPFKELPASAEECWPVQGHAPFQHWMLVGCDKGTVIKTWPLIPTWDSFKINSVFRTSMNLAEAFTETTSQFSFSLYSALPLSLPFHRCWSQSIPQHPSAH